MTGRKFRWSGHGLLNIFIHTVPFTHVFSRPWSREKQTGDKQNGDKQTVNNYRAVSLLPVRGKIFEILIFNFFI